MKPILHKWQWWFKPCCRNWYRVDPLGWRVFDAGIIKIHTEPENGTILTKEYYHGVIVRFGWWFPIDRDNY